MLFAPAEQNPYYWWWLKSSRAWAALYQYSPEWYQARWVGEMEMFRHEGGMKAYQKYRELLSKM